jgi:hypothetical protein
MEEKVRKWKIEDEIRKEIYIKFHRNVLAIFVYVIIL